MSYSSYLFTFPRQKKDQIFKELLVATRIMDIKMAVIIMLVKMMETSLTQMVLGCINLIFSSVCSGSISQRKCLKLSMGLVQR